MSVFEGGPLYASRVAEVESAKEGVRLALSHLAAQIDAHPTALWCALGTSAAAFIPSETAGPLEAWLRGRIELLDALQTERQQRLDLVAREFALLELLEKSQQDGNAVVRSLRFRLGTRVVRAGRKVMRKEAPFRASGDILARNRTVATWRARVSRPRSRSHVHESVRGRLRVTYVLPELRLSARRDRRDAARRRDASARSGPRGVVALKDPRPAVRRESFRWRLRIRPKLFASVEAMLEGMPRADIAVATHWSTAAWVRALVDAGRAKRAAYFLQDYEAWFFPEANAEARERVKETYGLIPDKIATSAWLRDLVREDGHDASVVPLGVDLGFFYPRPVQSPARPVVLAMARPRTPRRGFDSVVAALAKVHDAVPEADIVLFGENMGTPTLPFPYRAEGIVTSREHLARLYSGARVFFDCSDFQAFGLPALEAMACGAVSVLTNVGGVREYARPVELSPCTRPAIPMRRRPPSSSCCPTTTCTNVYGEAASTRARGCRCGESRGDASAFEAFTSPDPRPGSASGGTTAGG